MPPVATSRFVMTMRPAPRRVGTPTSFRWSGPAIIIGDNPIGDALRERLVADGVTVHAITGDDVDDVDDVTDAVDARLDAIWLNAFTPHLFITTPNDADASWPTTDADSLSRRRNAAIAMPYRVAQRWMTRAIDDGHINRASVVTVVRGGGDFLFGNPPIGETLTSNLDERFDATSSETGGVAGLTKAMLIECWMRGYRDTPMLVVDSPAGSSPSEVVDGVIAELATPSHDEEVSVRGNDRWTTVPIHQPLPPVDHRLSNVDASIDGDRITPGGVWIVAGGGRGITAMAAMELARRHRLKLHLLGMAPPPTIDAATRAAAREDRLALRRRTYTEVAARGDNPAKYWRHFEKAIEIDVTLSQMHAAGIDATYHSVDVSDAADVAAVLDRIRRTDGPIRGVIQGAGSGQDARFDRKRPDKVRQCLSAKIDGTASLAAATRDDPLEWFVGFGSISGRFGANGHTDYSAANDMMSKMIGRLQMQRPDTQCVTFHWHAWGDIGMATKPEAKLALEMIGMKFMPAREGLDHFLNELEHGGDATEVLITDRRYIRKFFASAMSAGETALWPMASEASSSETSDGDRFGTLVNPAVDRFLTHHTVGGRPTLPMVMAIEIMGESFWRHTSSRPTVIQNIVAHSPIKFAGDAPAVLTSGPVDGPNRFALMMDLQRRDGRIVAKDRVHFEATFAADSSAASVDPANRWPIDEAVHFEPVCYAPPEAPVHHGETLRCLRSSNVSSGTLRGIIIAPSPLELLGEDRSITRLVWSPAVADAVLYAGGYLVHHQFGRPSLPVSIQRIRLNRLPDAGEPLRATVEIIDHDAGHADLAAVLVGQNDELIFSIDRYRVAMLAPPEDTRVADRSQIETPKRS